MQKISPSSLPVAAMVGRGAAARRSVQTSRCAPIRARRTLFVVQKRVGTPTSSAYQREELFAADATDVETSPASPRELAAPVAVVDVSSAAIPSPATRTSA